MSEETGGLYPNLSGMTPDEDEEELPDPGLMREIFPNLSSSELYRTLVINTGASHGTLQDIKLPEYCGGHTFRLAGVRRTLFWRVSGDTVELTEQSTDVDVEQGRLRLQFPDTPVLEGISVHETGSALVLLLATVSSVHRLRVPLAAGAAGRGGASGAPSLLAALTTQQLRQPDSMHVLTGLASGPAPHTAASHLLADGSALYLLASPQGGGVVVRYLPAGGEPAALVHQLQTAGVVGRLWGLFSDEGAGQRLDAALVLPGPLPALVAVGRDGRLRLWSLPERGPPMLQLDLLALAAIAREGAAAQQTGTHRHRLRAAPAAAGGASARPQRHLLVAHLSLATQQQFVLLSADCAGDAPPTAAVWSVQHVATLCAPDHDLVDFALTNEALWTLWSTTEAEWRLHYCPLVAGGAAGWREVALVAPPPAVRPLSGEHISSAYLRAIFRPGRFHVSTVQRAVAIVTRRDCSATGGDLRVALVAAAEAQVQRAAPDYRLPEEQFSQLTADAWEALYSACLQYHQVATKPVGLAAAAGCRQVAVVRRALVSYLRPAELLERVWLSETLRPEDLATEPDPELAPELKVDVARLLLCGRLVAGRLPRAAAAQLSDQLRRLQPPETAARRAVDALQEADADGALRDALTQQLAAVGDLTGALTALLAMLQVDGSELPLSADVVGGGGGAFSSRLGEGLLTASVEQRLRVRWRAARSLLLLETLLLTLADRCRLSGHQQTAVRAQLLPETVIQVQAYFSLLWLLDASAAPVSPRHHQTALRQLAALGVADTAGAPLPAADATLLQLFVAGAGGRAARPAASAGSGGPWWGALPRLSAAVARLVWPVSHRALLPELLLQQGQYTALRECVRLQHTWCDWNSAARSLLLGLALLHVGQPDKACDVLTGASAAVSREPELLQRLLHMEPESPAAGSRLVRYFHRLTLLFEAHQRADCVLQLATAGIEAAVDADEPLLPTLWSVVFKYHLQLGHVTEAYTAMTDNPEPARRRDCLRQLVVTLHQRGDVATLVALPYVDMLHDVVGILEDRARASDPLLERYYDVLYSFHVLRSNYRRAGTVMYECARRLAAATDGLQRQADCLLACVNALQLLSAEYAWLVRPAEPGERCDALPAPAPTQAARRVTVVTLEEVRRELALVAARRRLQECAAELPPPPDAAAEPVPPSAAGATPAEVVARLVTARLYTDAVQLADQFELGAEPVVRALATELATAGGDEPARLWLSQSRPAGGGGAAREQAAALLRRLLERPPVGDTRLLRAAAGRLLQMGAGLPGWMWALYQRRSAAELGRLLLRHGQLEAAGQLLRALMEALLGCGGAQFGLQSAVHAAQPPVWFPYSLLDQVLAELSCRTETPAYAALLTQLTQQLTKYQSTLQRVSRDMVTVAR